MNLASTIKLLAGGPGSGCQGPNCGRKFGGSVVGLEKRLLGLGGRKVEFDEREIKHEKALHGKMLERGESFSSKGIKIKQGREHECHSNVCRLLSLRGGENYHIATGYALKGDGGWTRHSWLVDKRDGTVTETTPAGYKQYFGFRLKPGGEEDRFMST